MRILSHCAFTASLLIITSAAFSSSQSRSSSSKRPKLPDSSPLSWSLEEFSKFLGGSGKAKACWECFRLGIDPIWFYDGTLREHDSSLTAPLDVEQWRVMSTLQQKELRIQGWTRQRVKEHISKTASRGSPIRLSWSTLRSLRSALGSGIESSLARLSNMTTSSDGTTKLLLQLQRDGLLVETVIIPWDDRQKSTICVSSQVGCRQACTFCSTGRMGLLRNLSASEILSQLYWANKICRLQKMYPIDNCVFMGMGELQFRGRRPSCKCHGRPKFVSVGASASYHFHGSA
jgi:hypothetical protein